MKNITEVTIGDIVQAPGGNKYHVLGTLGSLIFLSTTYDYDLAHHQVFTVMQLEREKWKVLTPDGRTPMTRKEIENESFIKIID